MMMAKKLGSPHTRHKAIKKLMHRGQTWARVKPKKGVSK